MVEGSQIAFYYIGACCNSWNQIIGNSNLEDFNCRFTPEGRPEARRRGRRGRRALGARRGLRCRLHARRRVDRVGGDLIKLL